MKHTRLKELWKIENLLLHLSAEIVDYNVTTEEKEIEKFAQVFDSQSIQMTLAQGYEVLAMDPFPWEWVTDLVGSYWDKDAKKCIDDPVFYHKWLTNILKMLDEEARKQGKI